MDADEYYVPYHLVETLFTQEYFLENLWKLPREKILIHNQHVMTHFTAKVPKKLL